MSNHLGQFLKKKRGHVSKRGYAINIGLSATHVSDIESGYYGNKKGGVSIDTLYRLAVGTKTPIEDVIKMAFADYGITTSFKNLLTKYPNGVLLGPDEKFYTDNGLPVPDVLDVLANTYYYVEGKPVSLEDSKKAYTIIKTIYEKI